MDLFEKAARLDIQENPDAGEEVVEGEVVKYCANTILLEYEDKDDITLTCDRDENHKGEHHAYDENGEECIWYDVIVLTGDPKSEEGLSGECSCERFKYGPSKNLMRVGLEVFKHANEWGHLPRTEGLAR